MRPINVDRLGAAMMARNLTYARLAELAGLSQAAVCHAMAGGRVRPSTLAAMAKALVDSAPVEGAAIIIDAA